MINRLKYLAIELYILLPVVLMDRSYLSALSVLFGGTVLLCALLNMGTYAGRSISKRVFWGIALLTISLIIIVVFSKYRYSNTLMVFVFTIISYLEFGYGKTSIPEMNFQKYFDFILAVGIFVYWIQAAVQNISDNTLFILPSAWDKNYTGMTIFLLFVYFYKRKHLLGIIACIPYVFTLNSRLLQVCLGLIIVLKIGLNFFVQHDFIRKDSKFFSLRTSRIFWIIIISTIAMVGFSFIWTTYVSNSFVDSYQSSWNDTSNAIRTRSNLYASYLIVSDNDLVIYGYDDDIKKVLGVEDENSATLYSGYRLVQPHNLVLNLFIKHGILFSLLYLYLLCRLISLYWNQENIPLLMTYLVANMVMHSLLSSTYLLLFFFVMCTENKERHLICYRFRWGT